MIAVPQGEQSPRPCTWPSPPHILGCSQCPPQLDGQSAGESVLLLILGRRASMGGCSLQLNPCELAWSNMQPTTRDRARALTHAPLPRTSCSPGPGPLPGEHQNCADFLAQGVTANQAEQLRINTSTRRPTGSAQFVRMLEQQTGHVLRALKPGPKAAQTRMQSWSMTC